jgi:class 3 adenylate cyclase
LTDQTIVVSDLRQFGEFSREASTETVEDVLVHYENLSSDVCHRYGGTVRSINGDACLLTFEGPDAGIAAVQDFARTWLDYVERRGLPTHAAIGATLGSFQVFRSFSFGRSLDFAAALCALAKLPPKLTTRAILSDRIVALLSQDMVYREVAPESYLGTSSSHSDARRDPLVYSDFLEIHRTYELEIKR